jgi:hypothetical protein
LPENEGSKLPKPVPIPGTKDWEFSPFVNPHVEPPFPAPHTPLPPITPGGSCPPNVNTKPLTDPTANPFSEEAQEALRQKREAEQRARDEEERRKAEERQRKIREDLGLDKNKEDRPLGDFSGHTGDLWNV